MVGYLIEPPLKSSPNDNTLIQKRGNIPTHIISQNLKPLLCDILEALQFEAVVTQLHTSTWIYTHQPVSNLKIPIVDVRGMLHLSVMPIGNHLHMRINKKNMFGI